MSEVYIEKPRPRAGLFVLRDHSNDFDLLADFLDAFACPPRSMPCKASDHGRMLPLGTP